MLKLLGLPSGFLGFFIVCLLITYLIDLPLTKEAKLYIPEIERVSFEDNGLVYLNGFNVPSNIHPYDYGLFTFQKRHGLLNKENDYNHLEKLELKKDSLEFKGEDDFDCWYEINYEPSEGEALCPSEAELKQSIKDNKLLLKRLSELSKYKNFETDMRITDKTMIKGQSFISLQRLVNAQIILMAQNSQTSGAFKLWQSNLELQKNLLRSADSLVWGAVVSIGLNISQRTILKLLPHILEKDLLVDEAINSLLTPVFSEKTPYTRIFARDYKYAFEGFETTFEEHSLSEKINIGLLYRPRSSKNRYAGYVKMIAESEALDQKTFFNEYIFDEEQAKQIIKGKWYSLPFYNIVGELLLGGVIKGKELITNWRFSEVYSTLVAVVLYAQKQEIKPENMDKFLHDLPEKYLNPITQKPFNWDGEKFTLINPKYPDNIREIPSPLN